MEEYIKYLPFVVFGMLTGLFFYWNPVTVIKWCLFVVAPFLGTWFMIWFGETYIYGVPEVRHQLSPILWAVVFLFTISGQVLTYTVLRLVKNTKK